MKYTFEWCWLSNQYRNQQLTYLLALKRSWGSKQNDYSLHSPGLAAVQVLKNIKHTPDLEMGMGLWRSGPKSRLIRLNLAPKIYTNSFSTSLQTIAASSNLSCRKWRGRIIPAELGTWYSSTWTWYWWQEQTHRVHSPIWLLFVTESYK